MTDDQLSAIFHGAADTIDTSTGRLVDAAIAQGRRQRRNTRLATAGSAVAVAAGVAAVGVNLLSGSGGSAHSPVPAGVGAPTAAGVSTASTAPVQPAAPQTVTMTPQALLQTLLDQLPSSVRTSHYTGTYAAASPKGSAFAGAQLLVDDGHGSAAVTIGSFGTAALNGIEPCTAGEPDCTVLSDGTTVQADKGHQYPSGHHGPNAAEWSVTVVRPDGTGLTFYEYNAPQPKDAAVDRPAPPFSTTTVTRWLLSPAYSRTITKQRAEQAARLFTPTDLQHP